MMPVQNLPTVIAVIKDETVVDIVYLRKDAIERAHADKLVDITAPEYAKVKVGDPWPNRENRIFIERLKVAKDESKRTALIYAHTARFGESVVKWCQQILEQETTAK